MRKEIIKTDNYLLLVSDEEIKPCKNPGKCIAHFSKPCDDCGKYQGRTVIAHLPLNGSLELEGVALLPKIEDEYPLAKFEYDDMDNYIRENHTQEECIGFYDGYNKAKEVYKYTEEDLRKVIHIAKSAKTFDGIITMDDWINNGYEGAKPYSENEIIQSLQQPKYPIAFECIMEYVDNHDYTDFEDEVTLPSSIESIEQPKTTINLQGKMELVGTYIWE